jgi:hypothetical protein
MSELGRLAEDGDAFERELLASARGDRMSGAAKQRLVAAVGVGAGVGAIAADAAAASARATAVKAWLTGAGKWIVLGVLASAAVGAVAVPAALRRHPASAPPGAPVVQAAPPVESPTDPVPAASDPAPPSPEPSTATAQGTPSARSGHATARPPSSLQAELLLIERARGALASGRAHDALAALDEHRARFPRGALAEEEAVLRIESYRHAGDTKTASSLARAFLARHPHGPYTPRVKRALDAQ